MQGGTSLSSGTSKSMAPPQTERKIFPLQTSGKLIIGDPTNRTIWTRCQGYCRDASSAEIQDGLDAATVSPFISISNEVFEYLKWSLADSRGQTRTDHYLILPAVTTDGRLTYKRMIKPCAENDGKPLIYYDWKEWHQTVRSAAEWFSAYQKSRGLDPLQNPNQTASQFGSTMVRFLSSRHGRGNPAEFTKRGTSAAFVGVSEDELSDLLRNPTKVSFDPSHNPAEDMDLILSVRSWGDHRPGRDTHKVANVIVNTQLSRTGQMSIRPKLVIPSEIEDIKNVPSYLWKMFDPTDKSAKDSLDRIVDDIETAYASFDGDAYKPQDLVTKYTGRNQELNCGGIASDMAVSYIQRYIDTAHKQSKSAGDPPNVLAISTADMNNAMSTCQVETDTLYGVPKNAGRLISEIEKRLPTTAGYEVGESSTSANNTHPDAPPAYETLTDLPTTTPGGSSSAQVDDLAIEQTMTNSQVHPPGAADKTGNRQQTTETAAVPGTIVRLPADSDEEDAPRRGSKKSRWSCFA